MPFTYPTGFVLGDDLADEDNTIVKIMKAWLSTLQPIEDMFQAMLSQKDVNNAEGAQLDLLGKLVGQSRGGLSDTDYRRYISARVATNRSDGIFEDLLKVAILVLNNNAAVLTATNAGTATVLFLVEGIGLSLPLAMILSLFLQQAKSGGVRLQLEFNTDPVPANWFYLDATPQGHLDGSIMFDTLP